MENASKDDIDKLKEIISTPTQSELLLDKTVKTDEDFEVKIEKSIKTYKQIKSVLEEVNKIEKAIGKNIDKIKIGNIHTTKNELLLKEHILEGDSHVLKAHKAISRGRIAAFVPIFVVSIATRIIVPIYARREFEKGINSTMTKL